MANALQYYVRMLQDASRNDAYWRAIQQAVKPGMVVADIGTGQGLLAMMAAKAGARKVYAIERVPESQRLARHLIARNGFSDRIEIVEDHAETVVLPEPVDLVVSEILGNAGFDEGVDAIYRGFLRNNPQSRPRMIPERVRLFLQPIRLKDVFLGAWRREIAGIDLTPALEIADPIRPLPVDFLEPQTALAPPALLEDRAPGLAPDPLPESWRADFDIEATGPLDGFWVYFEADLIDGVTIDNGNRPDTSWSHTFFPVLPPPVLDKGQRLRVSLDRLGATHSMGWDLTHNIPEAAATR